MGNEILRYRGVKVIRGPDVPELVPDELLLEIRKRIDQRLSMATMLTKRNHRYEMFLVDPATVTKALQPAGFIHLKVRRTDSEGDLYIHPSVDFDLDRNYDYDTNWALDVWEEPVLVFLYEGELDFLM